MYYLLGFQFKMSDIVVLFFYYTYRHLITLIQDPVGHVPCKSMLNYKLYKILFSTYQLPVYGYIHI